MKIVRVGDTDVENYPRWEDVVDVIKSYQRPLPMVFRQVLGGKRTVTPPVSPSGADVPPSFATHEQVAQAEEKKATAIKLMGGAAACGALGLVLLGQGLFRPAPIIVPRPVERPNPLLANMYLLVALAAGAGGVFFYVQHNGLGRGGRRRYDSDELSEYDSEEEDERYRARARTRSRSRNTPRVTGRKSPPIGSRRKTASSIDEDAEKLAALERAERELRALREREQERERELQEMKQRRQDKVSDLRRELHRGDSRDDDRKEEDVRRKQREEEAAAERAGTGPKAGRGGCGAGTQSP